MKLSRIVLAVLLFAASVTTTFNNEPVNNQKPTKKERFVHFTKASIYACFALSSLALAGMAGWSYWNARQNTQNPISINSPFHKPAFDYQETMFSNPEFEKNAALIALITSASTLGYTSSKAVEHTAKTFASTHQSTAKLDDKLSKIRHLIKGGYWTAGLVGCYAITGELDKYRRQNHNAPQQLVTQFDNNKEAADKYYTTASNALALLSEGAVMVGTGYPLFRVIKEVELSVKVSPSSFAVTAQL